MASTATATLQTAVPITRPNRPVTWPRTRAPDGTAAHGALRRTMTGRFR